MILPCPQSPALLFILSVCIISFKAIPHNSKCRYGERGAAAAKPKAQIILDAAKVSAASGGNSEPKQGQRSQSARGFCPRSTMRVPQPDIIEHFGNADAVPQPPERCLSRQAGIVRCCPRHKFLRKRSNWQTNRKLISHWGNRLSINRAVKSISPWMTTSRPSCSRTRHRDRFCKLKWKL